MECSAFGGSCYFSKSKTSLFDCKFINNTVNFSLLNYTDHSLIKIYGGAVYSINEKQLLNCTNCTFNDNNVFVQNNHEKEMAGAVYLTKGTLNNCFFNDNVAHNGGDIEYNQTKNSQLMITNCYFSHLISKEQKIKSLIYFCLCDNAPSKNVFTSNSVVISSEKISYLFDGEMYSSNAMLKFMFNDNCISPFDNKIYKSNDLSIYNMHNNNVLFESAFKSSCQVNLFTQTSFSYFPTKTQYLPSFIPKPTASYNEDKIKVLEKIITLLIAVIVLQVIFVSIFIYKNK